MLGVQYLLAKTFPMIAPITEGIEFAIPVIANSVCYTS